MPRGPAVLGVHSPVMVVTPARLAAEALRFLPRKTLSRAIGRVAEVRPSRVAIDRAIAAFVKAYDIDMSEAVVPEGGYTSFDAFFTRRLRAGARPVDSDPRAVVSPADGRIEDLGPIAADGSITVKGKRYTVAELLGDPGEAKRYDGGAYFIVYLSPRDYHRVHAPVAGAVSQFRYVPGTLYPVNAIGLDHVDRVFAQNERIAIVQKSSRHGEVTTIMVGAIGVGRIGLAFDTVETNQGLDACTRTYGASGPVLARGDELGVFHLGSTAIVFTTAEAPVTFDVAQGASVRVGQAVARGGVT